MVVEEGKFFKTMCEIGLRGHRELIEFLFEGEKETFKDLLPKNETGVMLENIGQKKREKNKYILLGTIYITSQNNLTSR